MAAAAATAAGAVPTVAGDDVTAPMVDVLVGDDPLAAAGAVLDERVESNPTPFVFRLTVTLIAFMAVKPTDHVRVLNHNFIAVFVLFWFWLECFLNIFFFDVPARGKMVDI